jgi:TonB family protein
VKSVKPSYPEQARRLGVHGRVLVSVLINNEGGVERVCSSGDPLLAPTAEAAALGFQFRREGFMKSLGYIRESLVFDFVLDK